MLNNLLQTNSIILGFAVIVLLIVFTILHYLLTQSPVVSTTYEEAFGKRIKYKK